MSIALIEVFSDDENQAFRFLRIVDASKMSEIPQYTPITLEAGTTRVVPVPLQEPFSLREANGPADQVKREQDDFEKFEDLLRRRVQHALHYSTQRKLGNEAEFVELSDVMPITSEETMKQQRQELVDGSGFPSQLLDHDGKPAIGAAAVCLHSVSVENHTTILNAFGRLRARTRRTRSYTAVTRGTRSMEVLQLQVVLSHDFKTTNLSDSLRGQCRIHELDDAESE